jgi:hypothetical protein
VEVFYPSSIITSLCTTYVGDSDVVVKGTNITTEEGIGLRRNNYLLSATEVNINNYNALYLTSKQLNNNLLELRAVAAPKHVIFSTSFQFPSINKFLRISNTYSDIEFSTISDNNTIFEVEIQDENTLRIVHQTNTSNSTRDGFKRYYLSYNGTLFFFTDSSNKQYVSNYTYFNYLIDGDVAFLFAKQQNNVKTIFAVNDQLSATDISNFNWKSNNIHINYYVQSVECDFDASWASYASKDRNSMIVDVNRSKSHLPSNNLFYNNYTYISGGSIATNFITLKNQHTHKNFSYRADNLTLTDVNVPNVDMRNYVGMHTGVEQEQGSESITLLYEFQNADYRMKTDKYTVFKTPRSLYPYDQINVNDTLFARQGAIGGDTPYTADKIFFNDTRPGQSDGQYLCTWLSAARPDGPSIWIDRYYDPERASYIAALTAKSFYTYLDATNVLITAPLPPSAYYDAPFAYPLLEDEAAHTPQTIKDALYGEYFFDKASDLIFVPDQEYIYQRMGNKYVTAVLTSLTGNLIQNGIDLKSAKGVDYAYTQGVDDIEYQLNNDAFAMVESYKNINNTNEFTASFWLNSDDWSQSMGHEVVGSFNDSGFGVFNDQMVTPIITVQNGRKVAYLNTNFQQIDVAHLSQTALNTVVDQQKLYELNYVTTTTAVTSFFIKDLIRGDHLDINMPVVDHSVTNIVDRQINTTTVHHEECGLILSEDEISHVITPLQTDRVYDINLTPLTGMEIEPCKFSVDKSLIQDN